MGKNKLKKFADMHDWAHVFEYAQSDYAFHDCPLKGRWHDEVFGNPNPIVLELGCGKGEYSVGLAEARPDANFIGIDIKGSRMWTGAGQALAKGLKNVVFLRTHIEFITSFFGPGEVAEIWLTFPDPQMKKVRKRLTSTRFMPDYARILQTGGLIHLKTDSRFMFAYTRAMIEANGLPVAYCSDNLYRDGSSKPLVPGRGLPFMDVAGVPNIQTFYEKQWLQRGLDIKYIRFSIPEIPLAGRSWSDKEAWVEPDVEIEPDEYRSFGRSARWIEGDVEVDAEDSSADN